MWCPTIRCPRIYLREEVGIFIKIFAYIFSKTIHHVVIISSYFTWVFLKKLIKWFFLEIYIKLLNCKSTYLLRYLLLSAITSRKKYLDELQELLQTENILLARACDGVSWLGQLKLICLWKTLFLKCCGLTPWKNGQKI